MRSSGRMWVQVAAAMSTMIISGCSNSEPSKPPSSEQPAARSAAVGTGGAGASLQSDDEFVRDVAAKNTAAVELSRMALDKATDPNIKLYAQRTIDQHDAAGQKLKSVVTGQPIAWPTELDDKYRKITDALGKKQASDFEQDYLEAMIEGQQDLAAKLESRLDLQSVADWKTAAAGRTQSKALPEPQAAMGDIQVRPNKSDNQVTMRINQWAADTYPLAQKLLDTARTLDNASKKRPN